MLEVQTARKLWKRLVAHIQRTRNKYGRRKQEQVILATAVGGVTIVIALQLT